MMAGGAIITGLAWVALSRATSFGEFLAINGLLGICVGASTIILCSLVIANWFEERRGLAMGIAFSGLTLGGAAMTIVANYTIAVGGWRVGLRRSQRRSILLFVRTTNSTETDTAVQTRDESRVVAESPASLPDLPGLELSQATRDRSFWLIATAQLFAGLSFGLAPHYVAYLIGIGYSAIFGATAVSLFLIVTTAGTLLGGPLADRIYLARP
jgi:MFS family permease